MVQLTRLAAPLCAALLRDPSPHSHRWPSRPQYPVSIAPASASPPSPPVTTLLANVLRVTHNEPKLQIAPPFAITALTSRKAVWQLPACCDQPGAPSPPVAVLPQSVVRSAVNVPSLKIAPPEPSPPETPGTDALARCTRRSRSCPPRCRGPASPCRYCEWHLPGPCHRDLDL